MLELLWKIVDHIQTPNLFWPAAAASFFVLLACFKPVLSYLHIPFLRRSYLSFSLLTLLILLILSLKIPGSPQTQAAFLILLILGLLLTLTITISFCLFVPLQLSETNRVSESGDLIQAWRVFKDIPESMLLPHQRSRYTRSGVYLLTLLGCYKKADQLAEALQTSKPAVYYMYKGMQGLNAGNIQEATEAMQQAYVKYTSDTPRSIYLQILTNLGVMMVLQGNYSDADFYYHRALEEIKNVKKPNPKILHTIYYNYLFNLIRLTDAGIQTRETWQQALENYKSQIDQNDPEACISVFNTELEMLRQTNADSDTIHALVDKTLQYVMNSDAPIQNKCIFEGSMARIIATMFGDPEPCLKLLARDWVHILQLPMPARYLTVKEIDLLFRDLRHDGLLQEYHQLDNDSEQYIQNQAQDDIRQYIDQLPEEAILERCLMRQELAGMQRHSWETYQFSTVRNILESNISIYAENHLNIEIVKTRLAIMDECLYISNLTDSLEPRFTTEMEAQQLQIEQMLPPMDHHPILAECALRLSYYSFCIHKYPDCVRYYRLFSNANIALAHYAPWLRSYYRPCELAVRILEFDDILRQIHTDAAFLDTLSEPARKWFLNYPTSDGYDVSVLLGKFLDQNLVYVKRRLWFAGNTICAHCWYHEPQLDLDVDLVYHQFVNEPLADHIFFQSKHHPFESGASYFIQKCDRESGKSIPRLQMRAANLDAEWPQLEGGYLGDVWNVIQTYTNTVISS